MRRTLVLSALLCFAAAVAGAPDPVKVDPGLYKVEVDNTPLRALRIHYGPHEKSVMRSSS